MTLLHIDLTGLVTAADKFEERKAAKIEAIKKHGDGFFQIGFPFETPEHGVQHLQTRNNTDKTNWLTSQGAYQAAIAMGQGDVPGANFRTAENNTLTRTFMEGYQLLMGMAAWGAHLYGVSWAKQDEVRACVTDAELDLVSIEDGWNAN